jgi:hypothetical protein
MRRASLVISKFWHFLPDEISIRESFQDGTFNLDKSNVKLFKINIDCYNDET